MSNTIALGLQGSSAEPRRHDRTRTRTRDARIRTRLAPAISPARQIRLVNDKRRAQRLGGVRSTSHGAHASRLRVRLIAWRGATNRGHTPGVQQALPVSHRHAGRLFRPAATGIATANRKSPLRSPVKIRPVPVPAMRRGREAHDQQPRPGRPPAGNGASPSKARRGTSDGARRPLPPARRPGRGQARQTDWRATSSSSVTRPGGQLRRICGVRTRQAYPAWRDRQASRPSESSGRASPRPATMQSRRGCRARSPGPRRSRTAA